MFLEDEKNNEKKRKRYLDIEVSRGRGRRWRDGVFLVREGAFGVGLRAGGSATRRALVSEADWWRRWRAQVCIRPLGSAEVAAEPQRHSTSVNTSGQQLHVFPGLTKTPRAYSSSICYQLCPRTRFTKIPLLHPSTTTLLPESSTLPTVRHAQRPVQTMLSTRYLNIPLELCADSQLTPYTHRSSVPTAPNSPKPSFCRKSSKPSQREQPDSRRRWARNNPARAHTNPRSSKKR